MGNYSKRRQQKRQMYKTVGNNRNNAPVKDDAGNIINKSGYNPQLIEEKQRHRGAETIAILEEQNLSENELEELVLDKGIQTNKKFNDMGKLIETDYYYRRFSSTDKKAINMLIEQQKEKSNDKNNKRVDT